METANISNGHIENQNHLIDNSSVLMNEHHQIQNSINHSQQYQQLNQLSQLDQINQLNYIDDYQSLPNDKNFNLPYYNDLKLNEENLQRLQINDDPNQQLERLKHWSKVIYDCNSIQLFEWNIAGGSDYGQLTYFIDSGDIILEIDGIKISGYTCNDVKSLIKKQQYHFIKAVSSSSSFGLPIDLKEYLSRRFVRGSIDHDLQSTIRDNIYIRTVPCTTRLPKSNEIDGIDYKFVTKMEFLEMERNGVLLESGQYCGHYYGTPLPLSNPIINYTKMLNNETEDNCGKIAVNGKLNEAISTGNSINNKDQLLSSSSDLNQLLNHSTNKAINQQLNKNQESTNSLQQSASQLSAMALKRRRNRSNIDAIDANALPSGWECIRDDYVHGVYYIDHINKRTQYERPYEIELKKGSSGFGFTLSYLNSGVVIVKTILPNGPASSGIVQPGDILVSVSNVSVSGLNHSDIAKLFSTFSVGDRVKLTFARSLQISNELLNLSPKNDENLDNDFDLITVDICKGTNGFGFTISDATNGQKVKKILDIKRCGLLKQGDLLASVNGVDLSNLNHIEVVEILKNHCKIGDDTRFTVKRFKQRSSTQNNTELNVSNEFENDKEINVPSLNCANNLVQKNNFNYDAQQFNQNYNQTSQQESNKLNDNLIAELKANLALNNSSLLINIKNSVNNNDLLGSPSTNPLMVNNYSNIESNLDSNPDPNLDQNLDLNGSNLYSVIESNQNQFMNSTMVMDNSNQPVNEDEFEYFRVFLTRSATNFSFGFRIVGGTEEGRPVTVGSIVIGGVAHVDGILKAGDEIISINDQNVMNSSHHYVVKLMSEAENSVLLLVRRKKDSDAFDVVLNRDPTDTFGFGFVIISCGNCALIGRIIENSPASRCQRLKVRDKIIAVNNVNITQMTHPEIVNMIKDSGLQLKLRIIPADCYTVELIRGSKGFGFSIRGGLEFNEMPLFILRIASDGPACSLLNIGDEILEINNISTAGMTHAEAVLLIQQSGPQVKLKLRRRDVLSTTTSMTNFNTALNESYATYYE